MKKVAFAFGILAVLLGAATFGIARFSTDNIAPVDLAVKTAPDAKKSDAFARVADSVADLLIDEDVHLSESAKQAVDRIGRRAVVKIIDGDTIAIDMNGTREVVRLIGVDTPESVDPRRRVECFGKEASEYLRSELSGRRVTIEADPTQDHRDKYGRTLAYVFRDDGALMNERIIAEGYGREYTYAVPYQRQASFRNAEHRAQASERGLWAPHACTNARTTPPAPPQSKSTTGGVSDSFDKNAYRCDANTYNCSNFQSQAEAQYVFLRCGGASNDVHKLDRDGDGSVCESLK